MENLYEYSFYIPYLGIDILLTDEDLKMLDRYVKGEIGFTRLYRYFRDILLDAGVRRGYLRSTLMYIVGLYERREYTIVRAKWLRIVVDFLIKTAYWKKYHEFITEATIQVEMNLPMKLWKRKRVRIIDKLSDAIFEAYRDAMLRCYFFVQEEYLVEHSIVLEDEITEEEEMELKFKVIDVWVGVARKEGAEIRYLSQISKCVYSELVGRESEFLDIIKEVIRE